MQRVAVAGRQAVQGAGGLEALGVIHGHRPERVHRRESGLLEMQDVPAGERMAVGIGHQDRIDGAFWRVRA
jgi:hypothetical protein